MSDIKCVVVGDGYVGKTSLLVTGTTNGPIKSEPIFDFFTIYSTTLILNGKLFNLKLHDTRGQEYYDRLRPLAYSLSDVILVCFSVVDRPSFDNVFKKWFPEIRYYCPNTPIILVGTQIDFRNDANKLKGLRDKKMQPVTYEEGKSMRKKIDAVKYVECSIVTKQGLQAVFEEAVRAVTPNKFQKSPIGKFLKKMKLT